MNFIDLLEEIQIQHERGEYEKSRSMVEMNINLYNENSEEFLLLKTFIGAISRDVGRNQEAISQLHTIIIISRNLKFHLPRLFALSELSYNHYKLRHYDLMRQTIDEATEVIEELNKYKSKYPQFQKIILSKIYNITGLYHWNTGSLAPAIDDFKMYLEKCSELNHDHGVGVSLNNLAALNYTLGNADLALEYIEQAISIWSKLKKVRGYAFSYKNLGLIYYVQNKTILALTNLELAYEFYIKVDNRVDQAETLFHMILICINEGGMAESVNKYISSLKLISEKYDQDIISTYYNMALNISYMKTGRLLDITKAYTYFQEVFEKDIEFKITAIAIRYMCEFLIIELKNENSEQVFKELIDQVKKLRQIGENTPAYTILIESLILEAKIIFSKGDLKSATKCLDKARKIAEEHGLFNSAMKIDEEKELFGSLISKIQKMIDTNASKYELLNEVEMQDYINDVKKIIGI